MQPQSHKNLAIAVFIGVVPGKVYAMYGNRWAVASVAHTLVRVCGTMVARFALFRACFKLPGEFDWKYGCSVALSIVVASSLMR